MNYYDPSIIPSTLSLDGTGKDHAERMFEEEDLEAEQASRSAFGSPDVSPLSLPADGPAPAAAPPAPVRAPSKRGRNTAPPLPKYLVRCELIAGTGGGMTRVEYAVATDAPDTVVHVTGTLVWSRTLEVIPVTGPDTLVRYVQQLAQRSPLS